MFATAYNILSTIQVENWYCGNITALYAFNNVCTVSKADQAKIRRRLLKAGYKCVFNNSILSQLIKLA